MGALNGVYRCPRGCHIPACDTTMDDNLDRFDLALALKGKVGFMTKRSRLHGWRALGFVLSLMVLTAWHGVQAAAVDAAAARAFAANWLASAGDPLNNGLSEKTLGEGAIPIPSDAGVTLAYAIGLKPAGFVVIAADDRLSPLVMFSDSGAFSLDTRNPALAFLKADLTARFALFTAPEPITVSVANTDAIPGDFTGDGTVDYNDILMFATYYGTVTTSETAQYDLNSDGVIDYKDVLILASTYDSGSTRSALYASVRANPVIQLKLVETSGKSVFQVGDSLSFELRLSAPEAPNLKGVVAVVSFDSSVLDFTSELTTKAIIDEDWRDLGAGVEVLENGGIQLRGINLSGIAADPGQEFTIARFTMEAKAECAAARITLSDPEGTSDRGNTVNGTLDAEVIQAPAFTISNGDNPPAITLAFEVTASTTRASEKVGLILATRLGASADVAVADGDIVATPAGPEPYRLVSKAGDIELVRDFRPLADDTTWPIAITVTEGTLTLDWALSLSGTDPDYAMPAYYNFYLDLGDGSQPILLNAPGADTSISLPVGTYHNASVRAVKADFCKTLTLSLNAGWNLIGLPFALDDDSAARLAALKPSTLQDGVYSPAAVDDFTAGQVLWLNLAAATELTLSGIVTEPAQGVAVKAGWNFVTPLWGATLTRPDTATVPIIWRWPPEGYRDCLDGSTQELARGYWLYSTTDQLIWTK